MRKSTGKDCCGYQKSNFKGQIESSQGHEGEEGGYAAVRQRQESNQPQAGRGDCTERGAQVGSEDSEEVGEEEVIWLFAWLRIVS